MKNLTPSERAEMSKALEKEWHTISVEKKGVVKVLTMVESDEVRSRCPHLIVPSRVVYTWKMEEAQELLSCLTERKAKGRWTIKGYKSPYLEQEHAEGGDPHL